MDQEEDHDGNASDFYFTILFVLECFICVCVLNVLYIFMYPTTCGRKNL